MRTKMMWPLLLVFIAGSASAGSVSPFAPARIVRAEAISGTPDSDGGASPYPGDFDENASAYSSQSACLPPPFPKCVVYSASASASQVSSIGNAPDGALEIEGQGTANVSVDFSGEASAASLLISGFEVIGTARYLLEADGSGDASVVLVGPSGEIFSLGLPGGVSRTGLLPEGSYEIAVVAQRQVDTNLQGLSSSFDLHFRVEPEELAERPACEIEMSQESYGFGDVVIASVVRLDNPTAETIPIELKIWLGLPDGGSVSARNEGADGTLGLLPGSSLDFGPVPILGVGADTESGGYEFSCRLLDPITGETLAEDRNLFSVLE